MVPTLTIGREKGDKTAARFYLLFSAYGKLKTLVLMYNMYNFMCSLSCTIITVAQATKKYTVAAANNTANRKRRLHPLPKTATADTVKGKDLC